MVSWSARRDFLPAGLKPDQVELAGDKIRVHRATRLQPCGSHRTARSRPSRVFMTAGQVSDCTGAAALLGSLPAAPHG